MIKKTLFMCLFILQSEMAYSQLDVSNGNSQTKAFQDVTMLIQIDAKKVEVLPKLRGLPQKNGSYQIIESSSLFSQDVYGVAYDHTQKAYVFLSGEVSFKIISTKNLSSLPSALSLKSKMVVSPDIYVMNAVSPSELVSAYNQLKASKTIEWVELKLNSGAIK